MSEYSRGSEWRKWDFQVHTPYSILHNEYKFDPNDEIEDDCQDPFDNYVKILFEKAIDKEVVAIGITDYFSIDGYKRIRQKYLNNPEKMKELFPDETHRAKIKDMFIFPNIELRLETFVGEKSNAINYHVIFSDSINERTIEECFLQRLELPHAGNRTLPLTKNNIEIIGREYKTHNPGETRSDYLVGMEKISVDYKNVLDILDKSDPFASKYLIFIPVDEDLSQIDWRGRDYQTRKILYQQCNLLLTSNARTRNWALAKGHEKEQIAEFKSIKPCVWGSDAHSYERMFSPKYDLSCWIKADPTFEGLEQILYEPEDRVRIQKDKPEEKDAHQIIDHVVFHDNDFPTEPVYLSEGLTAIIGGKSTGKSILIRHIAKGIDPKQVDEREGMVGTNNKMNIPIDVYWKDGVSGVRKIIYIPQSWLNRIVDESSGDSQLNTMLRGILFQQEDIEKADKQLKKRVEDELYRQKHDILNYVLTQKTIVECEDHLREHGRSEAFKSEICKLEKQREAISVEAGITEEELQKHAELEKKITEHKSLLETIEKEKEYIESLQAPFVFLPHVTTYGFDETPYYDLDKMPTVKTFIDETIKQMNFTVHQTWEAAIQKVKQTLSKKREETKNDLSKMQTSFTPLQQLVSKNDQLKKIDKQLQEEKVKLRNAESYEKIKTDNINKAETLKNNILLTRNTIQDAYNEFATTLSAANNIDSNLSFKADVQIRRNELIDTIYSLFDNRNLRGLKEKYKIDLLNKEDLSVNNTMFEGIWNAINDGTLVFKGGNTLQPALERLFSDWYYVHYNVSSGNDTISNMSPGKKALVLLEMIVNLEKGKCPILIDQPEDDLDNRSIYTDLVTYLKSKKHERQIIVVTHNANVVVGADAEEVIIANQNGKEAPNHEKRFEYRSGSIENTVPVHDKDGNLMSGVLNQKGIQEQICDILEGGKDAFELRRKKYISSRRLDIE